MIDTYRDIFNHRGQGYHQAMRQNGIARQAEFQQVIQLAALSPDMTLGDIPSGGSYLQTYLNHPAFYREAHRLLKPNELFILADVQENTPVAHFLNGFVHRHNSQGHRGQFLSRQTRSPFSQSCN
jgi:hypothetical protein